MWLRKRLPVLHLMWLLQELLVSQVRRLHGHDKNIHRVSAMLLHVLCCVCLLSLCLTCCPTSVMLAHVGRTSSGERPD